MRHEFCSLVPTDRIHPEFLGLIFGNQSLNPRHNVERYAQCAVDSVHHMAFLFCTYWHKMSDAFNIGKVPTDLECMASSPNNSNPKIR